VPPGKQINKIKEDKQNNSRSVDDRTERQIFACGHIPHPGCIDDNGICVVEYKTENEVTHPGQQLGTRDLPEGNNPHAHIGIGEEEIAENHKQHGGTENRKREQSGFPKALSAYWKQNGDTIIIHPSFFIIHLSFSIFMRLSCAN